MLKVLIFIAYHLAVARVPLVVRVPLAENHYFSMNMFTWRLKSLDCLSTQYRPVSLPHARLQFPTML